MALSPDAWARVKVLFAELEELAPEEQAARLAALPPADQGLRGELESLLGAARNVGERFEQIPTFPGEIPAEPSLVGQVVGAYRLVRELGHGGMGTVYAADRVDDQYAKRVAIKMVRLGGDHKQALRRFHRERQLLASLEHRNIATLLDGGVTDDGTPYFIMEYVEGLPIDRWCHDQRLSIRGRLQLFRQVCAAVQYAHEHLVIHRDLKPGNILVGADGTVKLLDFGIAKLVDPNEEADELLTRPGALPMTVAYASPEQLRGDPVSIASDIYSLGVVLYELLTGQRPFPPTLRGPALTDRGLPQPPSRAVLAEAASTTEENSAGKVRRALTGEVDAIVLMALRPEVGRRYRSVQQFTDDIQRHLTSRPILAQPDTLGYRAAKFVRRNAVAVGAGAVAVTALVAGTLMSVHQARVARAERDRAVLEQRRTAQVTQFFQDVLSTAKPQDGGLGMTVVDAIDRVIPRIDSTFANEPDLRAAIKNTLGATLTDMALYDRARPLVEDALRLRDSIDQGRPSRERADALYNMAGLEVENGASVHAESLYRAALHMYGQVPGFDSVDIYLGMNNLAGAVLEQGRLQEAADIYTLVGERLAVLRPADSVAYALNLTNSATALAQLGRYAAAEPQLRKAALLFAATRGANDPRVAAALQPLAGALLFQGKFAEAESVATRAWRINVDAVGPANPVTLAGLRMLINVLADGDRCPEAIPHARYIIGLRDTIGDADVSLNTAMLFLGWCLAQQGHVPEGARWAREGLQLRVAIFPEGHWAIANAESMLGDVLARLGPAHRREAEGLLRRGYDGMKRELDSTHVRVTQAKQRLDAFLSRQSP